MIDWFTITVIAVGCAGLGNYVGTRQEAKRWRMAARTFVSVMSDKTRFYVLSETDYEALRADQEAYRILTRNHKSVMDTSI